MRAVSPWMKRLAAMCAEGPVPYDEAVASAMWAVPPGRAWRNGERTRKWKASRRSSEKHLTNLRDPERDWEDRIRIGAREIVRSSMWGATRNGRFEVFVDEDGDKMIRLGPNAWTEQELSIE